MIDIEAKFIIDRNEVSCLHSDTQQWALQFDHWDTGNGAWGDDVAVFRVVQIATAPVVEKDEEKTNLYRIHDLANNLAYRDPSNIRPSELQEAAEHLRKYLRFLEKHEG